ncbi:MAG: AmmeMemoRadiSam system protein B, partial [Thermoanaerobaculia bacterium]
KELSKEVKDFIKKATQIKTEEKVLAIVSPHAGYVFSGATAGRVFKVLEGKNYKKIILMGTSHTSGASGALLADYDYFQIPGAKIPLERNIIKELSKKDGFQIQNGAHTREHSLEVQLPFLKEVLKDFKIIPMVIGGSTGPEVARRVAKGLLPFLDEETLVVVSTDFTHYGPNYGYIPFREDVPRKMKDLDLGAWELIFPQSSEIFSAYLEVTEATICGEKALMVLSEILPKNSKKQFVHYTTSGEIMGDWENAVGYLAGFFTGKWDKNIDYPEPKKHKGILTEKEKEYLLKLSRATLKAHTLNEFKDLSDILKENPMTEGITGIAGVFVTLRENDDLRGCIGSIEGREPLYLGVIHNTINAASRDPRFSPVRASEYNKIEIEISVLTPLKKISNYKDIVLGKHGVVLQKWGRSAVFLPQVATETGWNLDEFLSHLSLKAGLPGDAYKEGATFEVFEAIVFDE